MPDKIIFCELETVLCGFMIVKPALATQGFKEATCIVEETISLGKRECKCGGFSNDDPYCESRNVISKFFFPKKWTARNSNEGLRWPVMSRSFGPYIFTVKV